MEKLPGRISVDRLLREGSIDSFEKDLMCHQGGGVYRCVISEEHFDQKRHIHPVISIGKAGKRQRGKWKDEDALSGRLGSFVAALMGFGTWHSVGTRLPGALADEDLGIKPQYLVIEYKLTRGSEETPERAEKSMFKIFQTEIKGREKELIALRKRFYQKLGKKRGVELPYPLLCLRCG